MWSQSGSNGWPCSLRTPRKFIALMRRTLRHSRPNLYDFYTSPASVRCNSSRNLVNRFSSKKTSTMLLQGSDKISVITFSRTDTILQYFGDACSRWSSFQRLLKVIKHWRDRTNMSTNHLRIVGSKYAKYAVYLHILAIQSTTFTIAECEIVTISASMLASRGYKYAREGKLLLHHVHATHSQHGLRPCAGHKHATAGIYSVSQKNLHLRFSEFFP